MRLVLAKNLMRKKSPKVGLKKNCSLVLTHQHTFQLLDSHNRQKECGMRVFLFFYDNIPLVP